MLSIGLRFSLAVLLLASVGCGRLGFAERTAPDAPEPLDGAPADTTSSAPCDLGQPFGAPELISELVGPGNDATLRLRPDELTGVFWSDRSGFGTDLYAVRRASHTSQFEVTSIGVVNSAANDFDPMLSADGGTLVFSSARAGGPGGVDLYEAQANATGFDPPVSLDGLSSASTDGGPYLTAGSRELLFASDRSGTSEIYHAARLGSAQYGAPALIPELTVTDAYDPVLTTDGLTIYFRSTRSGGPGLNDIYSATRLDTAAVFGPATPVPGVNTAMSEGPNWVSPDGCRLYLTSDRSGTLHLWRASKP